MGYSKTSARERKLLHEFINVAATLADVREQLDGGSDADDMADLSDLPSLSSLSSLSSSSDDESMDSLSDVESDSCDSEDSELDELLDGCIVDAFRPELRNFGVAIGPERMSFARLRPDDGLHNWARFRFRPEDLPRLKAALQIPDRIKLPNNGFVCSGEEGLLLLLDRLHAPSTLVSFCWDYGLDAPALSSLFNTMVNLVHRQFSHLLATDALEHVTEARLRYFRECLDKMDCPVPDVYFFVDGKFEHTCKPRARGPSKREQRKYDQEMLDVQRELYNAYYSGHGLKWQQTNSPDGIIYVSGPELGSQNDGTMCDISGLEQALANLSERVNFIVKVYGDQGYNPDDHIDVPDPGGAHIYGLPAGGRNQKMKGLRNTSEWGMWEVAGAWQFLNYKANLKVFLSPVAKLWPVGAILANCKTCLYGNKTSNYLNCTPPVMEDYLRSAPRP